jgi:hypothetical protein
MQLRLPLDLLKQAVDTVQALMLCERPKRGKGMSAGQFPVKCREARISEWLPLVENPRVQGGANGRK